MSIEGLSEAKINGIVRHVLYESVAHAACERRGSAALIQSKPDMFSNYYPQTKSGQSTATIAITAHHCVWNMISRNDGVAVVSR